MDFAERGRGCSRCKGPVAAGKMANEVGLNNGSVDEYIMARVRRALELHWVTKTSLKGSG